MATVQPEDGVTAMGSPVVVRSKASVEVASKVDLLQKEGEAWKQKNRHSQTSVNITDATREVKQLESASLAVPLTERIAKMQEDSEKWKTRKRHSQLPVEAVVHDPADVGEGAAYRRTEKGHVVRAQPSLGATRRRRPPDSTLAESTQADQADGNGVQVGTTAAATAAAVDEDATGLDEADKGLYTQLTFPDKPFSAPTGGDGIIYTMVKPDGCAAVAASPAAAADSDESDSDESDADERELENHLLYDNEDYTGTAGFGNKKKARAVRRKKSSSASAPAPEGDHSGGEVDDDAADRSDEDLEEDASKLYDNVDYTGRHPRLQQRNVVRKKVAVARQTHVSEPEDAEC
mmetsp:Transcript_28213/g.73983  ORF Transcript_28213/g.73983 Transcript_28213/m.73983 type:complete len:348 (+) Transcript_28213:240-1283(+)